MQSVSPTADPPYARGALVAGRYRVESELGRGGMGVVLGAIDVRSGAPVALKVLRAEGLGDADTMRRLEREARALGKVASPHVAHVHEFGYDAGAPFLVLERLTGTTLAKVLHAKSRLAIDEALVLAREIALGLEAAHAAQVVHRDLKPSNVFLADTAGGPVAKIIDFGVCAMEVEGEATITRTATTVGTPSYMAPEQVTSPRDVDARADVWSLGVVLYEMLAGEKPFRGASMGAVFAAILSTVPPSVATKRPDCPPALAALVGRCLARDPSRRPASAGEVAHALAEIATGTSTSLAMAVSDTTLPITETEATDTMPMVASPAAEPAPPSLVPALAPSLSDEERTRRRQRRNLLSAIAAVVLVLVGATVGGLVARSGSAASAATPTPPASETAKLSGEPAPSVAAAPPEVAPSASASVVVKDTHAGPVGSAKPKSGGTKKPKTKPGDLDPRLIDTL